MAGDSRNITKFFVSNRPEGCTPWELRCSLEGFGSISDTYVAKKRDKGGSRFGFFSFNDVKDIQELEMMLGGVKMGEFKLKVNFARFAVENSGFNLFSEARPHVSNHSIPDGRPVPFNLRDARSYCDVVGKSKGDSSRSGEGSKGLIGSEREK
ncbi:putative RNA recognition motif domain, nucleotide-binding alpha-beta plait domain superfamily [Helianthus debilis subsp. tardiflorus]